MSKLNSDLFKLFNKLRKRSKQIAVAFGREGDMEDPAIINSFRFGVFIGMVDVVEGNSDLSTEQAHDIKDYYANMIMRKYRKMEER